MLNQEYKYRKKNPFIYGFFAMVLCVLSVGPVATDANAVDPVFTISIDGIKVIDEGSNPPITSALGSGWSIEGPAPYQVNISKDGTIGYITASGSGFISINADGHNSSVGKDSNGYSITSTDNLSFLFAGSGTVNLAGGINTKGEVKTADSNLIIGKSDSKSSKGITAGAVRAESGNITIYGDNTDVTSKAITATEISAQDGYTLKVASSNIAATGVNLASVSSGGKIDLTYTDATGLGITTADVDGSQSSVIPVNPYVLTSSGKPTFNLSWNRPGNNPDDNDRVAGGTIKVTAATGITSQSGPADPNCESDCVMFTDYKVEVGTVVTVQLLPNYGYQYKSGGITINSGPLAGTKVSTTALTDVGTYNFTMPNSHVILSAIFEPSTDIVELSSTAVGAATLALPASLVNLAADGIVANATTTTINGNVKLTISDTTTPADAANFATVAGNRTLTSYLNIGLEQVVNKGTASAFWGTSITDLGTNMTVSMTLEPALRGYTDYLVIRDHGTIGQVETTYDAATGVLTFKTDGFSTYAIAHGAKAPVASSSGTSAATAAAPETAIATSGTKTFRKSGTISAYSLRYLAKIKSMRGDKITFSLQSGDAKNVKIKKTYLSFKKAGTYIVQVNVKRKSGTTITKYVKVVVKK